MFLKLRNVFLTSDRKLATLIVAVTRYLTRSNLLKKKESLLAHSLRNTQSFMAEKTWFCRRPTSYIVFTENLRKWGKAVKPALDPREPLTAARHHLLKILKLSNITPPVEDHVSKQVASTFHIQTIPLFITKTLLQPQK